MRLTEAIFYSSTKMGRMTRTKRMRKTGVFNALLSNHGYGRIDGKMRMDRFYGRGDNVHNNEFPPIRLNRRPYAVEVTRSSRATRKRVDYDIPGMFRLQW